MSYIIQNLKVPLQDRGEVTPYLCRKLGCRQADLAFVRIVKEAVDARRSQIYFVYHLEFDFRDAAWQRKARIPLQVLQLPELAPLVPGKEPLSAAPVVIGAGPAGLFAAWQLAQAGYRPLLLERGAPVEERVEAVEHFWQSGELNPQSNVQFGEGGAGTFSDGKLTTQIRDPRIRRVLQTLVEAGAPADILYKQKPHVGTDLLRGVIVTLRRRIEALGGTVKFGCQVEGLQSKNGALSGLSTAAGTLAAQAAVLAVGHSARDTFQMLLKQGVLMESKPFSLGVRIEHRQEWIDAAQYGAQAGHPKLDPAEYKLVYHSGHGRTVYSFCMCPGGQVVASASEPGRLVTNGMSNHRRNGCNANSALLVGVGPQDFCSPHPLAGMEFQRLWEERAYALTHSFAAPCQRVDDFLLGSAGRAPGQVQPTYRPGVEMLKLQDCLPEYVSSALQEALPALGRQLKGFDHPEALLTGIETRSSSPLRILRDEAGESSLRGLYPAGEGAGYAGGIVSAAVDGLRAAEQIIAKYAPR